MAASICRLCRVNGRVQGVFFRASTAQIAQSHGLTGYAKNLPDGSVEVLVCGSPDGVQAVCEWLKRGPQMAKVETLRCEEHVCRVPDRFSTG